MKYMKFIPYILIAILFINAAKYKEKNNQLLDNKIQILSLPLLVNIYLENSFAQKIRKEKLKRQKYYLKNKKAVFYPHLSTSFILPGYYRARNKFFRNDSIYINDYTYLKNSLNFSNIFPFNAELTLSQDLQSDFYHNSDKYYDFSNTLQFKYYLLKKNVPMLEYESAELEYKELSHQQLYELNQDIISLCELYYEGVVTKLKIKISKNKLKQIANLHKIADVKYKSGIIDILTRNQIDLEHRQMEYELRKHEEDFNYVLKQLEDMIGHHINDINSEFKLYKFINKELSLSNNPQILKLQTQLKSADINYHLTLSEKDMYLTLNSEYNWGGSNKYLQDMDESYGGNNYAVSLSLEIPLLDGEINRRKVAKRRSEKKALQYKLKEKRNYFLTRWNYLTKKIKLIKKELDIISDNIKLAKENLQIANGMLMRGEISYSEWNNIEEKFEETRLKLINQKILLNKCILEIYQINGENLLKLFENKD